jgi:hypothetical protein
MVALEVLHRPRIKLRSSIVIQQQAVLLFARHELPDLTSYRLVKFAHCNWSVLKPAGSRCPVKRLFSTCTLVTIEIFPTGRHRRGLSSSRRSAGPMCLGDVLCKSTARLRACCRCPVALCCPSQRGAGRLYLLRPTGPEDVDGFYADRWTNWPVNSVKTCRSCSPVTSNCRTFDWVKMRRGVARLLFSDTFMDRLFPVVSRFVAALSSMRRRNTQVFEIAYWNLESGRHEEHPGAALSGWPVGMSGFRVIWWSTCR